MTRIVRRTLGDPVSVEMREELRRLASKADSEIDTVDIPETTAEQFAAARKRREHAGDDPLVLLKAS